MPGATPVPVRAMVCGLPVALSETVIVPGWLPTAMGVNVTLMVQFALAATEAPQVFVCVYSELATILVMVNAAVPGLVSVTVCAALGVLTVWLPNARLVGDKLAAGPDAAVPVPVRLTVCGLFAALSVKVIVPVRVPVAVGVNVTLIVQLPPMATRLPQVFVCPKSPLGTILEMLSAAVPVFVSVSVCAALVAPTVVPPAPALNVAMTDVRASAAEEVAVAVWIPVADMILSSEKASVADPVLGDASAFP